MVVVALVVLAGLQWFGITGQSTGKAGEPGLATGLGALNLVWKALNRTTHDNWVPISLLGLSSPTPYTPWISDWANLSNDTASLWACNALPIPSVWNSSLIPGRAGNVADGFAPFWQFAFAAEVGLNQLDFAVGTYLEGVVSVAGPLTTSNGCVQSLGLAAWTSIPSPAQPDFDSEDAAPAALFAVDSFDDALSPYAVIWFGGLPVIADQPRGVTTFGGYNSNWEFAFDKCGVSGTTPIPGASTAFVGGASYSKGTVTANILLGSNASCAFPGYNLTLTLSGSQHLGSGYQTSVRIGATPSVQGMAVWMVDAALRYNNGSIVLPAIPACTGWIRDLQSCVPSTGWVAALESPNGSWMDFCDQTGTPAVWAEPNAPLIANETIELLTPTSVVGSGEVLSLSPLVGVPMISMASLTL